MLPVLLFTYWYLVIKINTYLAIDQNQYLPVPTLVILRYKIYNTYLHYDQNEKIKIGNPWMDNIH